MDTIYCRKCGKKILGDSDFCMYCGEKIVYVSNIQNTQKNEIKQENKEEIKRENKKIKDFFLKIFSLLKKNKKHLIFIGLVAIIIIVFIKISNTDQTQTKTKNDQTDKKESSEESEKKEKELVPYNAYHGEIIIKPSYYRTCPFVVHTDTGENYYIYLEYIGAPSNSIEKREKNPKASNNESDLSVYAVGGSTINIDVPIGKYKMYYCTGSTFYGNEDKFGDETKAYVAEDILVFYVDNNFYKGNEITLYSVVNGNMDTSPIDVDEFP